MPATQTYVLNTGAKMPAIGKSAFAKYDVPPDSLPYSALGGWAGVTEEERAAAREWLLTALKVRVTHHNVAYATRLIDMLAGRLQAL